MIHRVATLNNRITLGYRVGRWFWFRGDPSHWYTQGCMVTLADGRRGIARSVAYALGGRRDQHSWWHRAGRIVAIDAHGSK